MCQSADEARLKGVEVTLYIRSFGRQADNWGAEQIDKTTTNDEGQFVFRHVPQVNPRDADYLMVARRHGRITMFGTLDHRHDWLDLRMPAARPFKGTVKNEQGKPVAARSSAAMEVRFTICPKAFSRLGPMHEVNSRSTTLAAPDVASSNTRTTLAKPSSTSRSMSRQN